LLEAVLLTCDRMAKGGVYDQIGGGFHRYAVDARWLVPHFEKMLYDNAQLPRLYLEAYQVTGQPELRRIVEETLDYVLRDMRHPEGGFYSATDADSEGEEGKYFVWTPVEVERLVDPNDVDLVCRYWDISEEGNFEGKSIPHVTLTVEQVARMFGRSPAEGAAALERTRTRLLAARAERVPPARDEKILASWNGLMIGTLAEAGRVLRTPRFVGAACAAAEFVWTRMRAGGKLLHGWAGGRAKYGAYLDDHAFVASALLDLYEATGDRLHLDRARELAAALDARFHDGAGGGYFFTAHDEERLIARSKPGADGSLPAGNAVTAHVLLRLHHLTGEAGHRARAEEILRLYHDEAAENPFAYATYLQALELYLEGPLEVVVVGRRGAADTDVLWGEVARAYLPHRVLVATEPGEADPPAPAVRGRRWTGGRPHTFAATSPARRPSPERTSSPVYCSRPPELAGYSPRNTGDAAHAARPDPRARLRCPARAERAPPGRPADRLAAPRPAAPRTPSWRGSRAAHCARSGARAPRRCRRGSRGGRRDSRARARAPPGRRGPRRSGAAPWLPRPRSCRRASR